MLPGIVSNCCRHQLEAGEELDSLVERSMELGYRVFELRQTCLGHCETDDKIPIPEKLEKLAEQFPSAQFNLAINVDYLNPAFDLNSELLLSAVASAGALSGLFRAHLRLVDLQTSGLTLDAISIGESANKVANLVRSMISINGVLSIEHSRQSWRHFRMVFDEVRNQLGDEHDRLLICFDPVNLLTPGDDVDPVEITKSLTCDEISMVHFKQKVDGRSCKTVCDGEIDWCQIIRVLEKQGIHGPGLLEIDPDIQIWDALAESRKYLQDCGLEFN